MLYFEVDHAVRMHDFVIERSGGIGGVQDLGRLASVLDHIQNDVYYPEFLDKLTHLCFSVIKNHAFNDGNKRTSIALGAFFLTLNGYDHCLSTFMEEMENVVVWVADNRVDKELLKDIVQDIVMLESREETKLALAKAVGDQEPGANGEAL